MTDAVITGVQKGRTLTAARTFEHAFSGMVTYAGIEGAFGTFDELPALTREPFGFGWPEAGDAVMLVEADGSIREYTVKITTVAANAVAPGHILTPLTLVTWDNPERAGYLTERIAMRRPGKPEELVGIVVMLASDASSYMSGMMIHVDGGCLAGGSPWPYDTAY